MDSAAPKGAAAAPPRAERRAHSIRHHGHEISDDYAWLRADNWQQVMRDPAVLDAGIRAYLEAENAYREQIMADTAELQETLFQEIKGRIKEDDSSVPSPDGPFAYFLRFREGGQYPLMCRTSRDGSGEQTLLDGDEMGKDKAYFSLRAAGHSPDHALYAYSTDEAGSELYTLKVRDLASGTDLPDAIPETTGGAVWSSDARQLYYVRLDDNHRPRQVFRHEVGTDAADDVLVYEEQDPGFFTGIGRSQSRRFTIIHTHDHETAEVHLIDNEKPQEPPRLLLAREPGHEYEVEHYDDMLIILTNRDGAEDFKIVSAPLDDPAPENWSELVPHVPGRLILSAEVIKDHLIRLERQEGLPRIVIRRLSDGAEHAISFDEEAYALGLSVGYEFDTSTIRFTYSSMTTPGQTFDYDVVTRERVLRKQEEVPSGHDPADYVTRRLLAPSHDGELVPVSILHHKSTALDGSAPCLLYGYGSYGISIPASFSVSRLSLVDRGFVYAIAHIRGGKDKGYGWYKAGKTTFKKNTFEDFIAAGEHLAKEKFTARGRIIAQGGSAGGMLMGAVANMAPDLFLGIIAQVPFVDVLNTMLDESLPLTPPEWPEWGNPITDADAFEYIRSYSPYDNVAPKDYPHMLVTGGLSDPRVTYWEPAKWVARLRELKTGDHLLLMKMNMEAGHQGRSGRFDSLRETAHDYAFALKIAGLASQ